MSTNPISPRWPILSLLIAATLWGVSWYPLRLLETKGLSGLWITLLVYGFALIAGLLLFNKNLKEFSKQPQILFLVAAGNAWCNVAFILAILEGNVMRVLLLFYLSPLWATLLGRWWLNERLTTMSWMTLVVAITGALVMLWDPSMGIPWPGSSADVLAITSGMGFALANASVRRLQDTSVPAKNLAAWLGVVVLCLLWLGWQGQSVPQVSTGVISSTFVVGGLLIMLMTFTVQYGVTHLPLHRSAIILLFELVAAALSSHWLSEERMSSAEWLGGMFIVFAGYLSARSQLPAPTDAVPKEPTQSKQTQRRN